MPQALPVIGMALNVFSSMQQGQAAQAAAKQQADAALWQSRLENENAQFQAKTAEMNAQMLEEDGKEAKREGHDKAQKKRLEAASLIGQQRLAAGASGAQVDQGSFLDKQLDTAEKGELDAFAINEQGLWADYDKRVQAADERSRGIGYAGAGSMALARGRAKASMFSAKANSYTPWLPVATTLLNTGSKLFQKMR